MSDYLFFARENEDKTKKQLLTEHINGVLSRSNLWAPSGFENMQKLCALMHDFGKFSKSWQEYMMNNLKTVVPHSPHGAYFIGELNHKYSVKNSQKENISKITADILRYVIASHHGMFDAMTIDGKQKLELQESEFLKTYGKIY